MAWLPEPEMPAFRLNQDEAYQRLTVVLMRDEVIPLLERHGVSVEWNGALDTRILVADVDAVVLV
ncbi:MULTISPECIES: hypothetical protein [unclassified Nocardioides]|uniref:hypothetical protein n=1 Tax=unclassified Nocardioides TaxID=2615069 RepID=UPI000702913F|nr:MULTISPECIES: hypothetical protein [unclassified Nocardioides]